MPSSPPPPDKQIKNQAKEPVQRNQTGSFETEPQFTTSPKLH